MPPTRPMHAGRVHHKPSGNSVVLLVCTVMGLGIRIFCPLDPCTRDACTTRASDRLCGAAVPAAWTMGWN